MDKCYNCKEKTEELCQDGFCFDCHVSISFEDCTSGTLNAQMMLRNGHSEEEVQRLYPRAKI